MGSRRPTLEGKRGRAEGYSGRRPQRDRRVPVVPINSVHPEATVAGGLSATGEAGAGRTMRVLVAPYAALDAATGEAGAGRTIRAGAPLHVGRRMRWRGNMTRTRC